jgi:methyl-accepting chemotaxis protein
VKLRSMLAVPMAVIMLITVLLVTVLSAGSIRSWREGQNALGRMEQLRQLLVLQEVLGLERGPTNAALSVRSVVSPELVAALAARRQASDRCLRDLAALSGLSRRVGTILAELSVRLTAARANADMVMRQPPEHRSAGSGAAAIDEMFALPPLLFPAVEEILADISAADPAVAPLLTATHTASDLRLYAGSIISKFARAMVNGKLVTMRDVGLIRIQQGQVIELHRLLLASISLANVGESARDVVEAMEQHYFGAAQGLIDWMIADAVDNGEFSMTYAQFLAESEPPLQMLVDVRDRLFVLTRQAIAADQADRLHRLEATAAAGGAVLLAVLAALLMLHRWIIRPLAELAAMVIRLAQGDRSVRLTARQGSREIVELASAIEVLRVATVEADAAAARRRVELQRWTAQLRQVLDTIDLMQARAATITDVLPALLEQFATLGQDDDDAVPALAAAVAAARAGIAVLRSSSGQLDAALQRMHAVSDGEDIRFEELVAAMDEVARVVTAIQEAVNDLPQITLSAMCDLSARTGRFGRAARETDQAVHERILAQVQEMAAAAGGLQSALSQATHGLGELARLRA